MKKGMYGLFLVCMVTILGAFFFFSSLTPTHAAGSAMAPSLTPSTLTFHPYKYIKVTAQGFAPNENVYLYLDSSSNFWSGSGSLTCDANGNCSGTYNTNGIELLAGSHTLYGNGETSGLQAQVKIVIAPGMIASVSPYDSPLTGGQNMPLEVLGAGFPANETDTIYWKSSTGQTQEGTATTNETGNLYFGFTEPANTAPGQYAILVKRPNQKIATLSANVKVIPPSLKNAKVIHGGNPGLDCLVAGFGADETVDLTWNANGGEHIGTMTTNNLGSGDAFTDNSLAAPNGTYIVTATGETTHFVETSSVTIGQGIWWDNSQQIPGSTVTVHGSGFAPLQNIQVYFQTTKNGVATTQTDASGAFSLSLTLPTTYDPSTSYFIYAKNSDGTEKAKIAFSFLAVGTGLWDSTPTYGASTTINGYDFAINEPVTFYWDYGTPAQKTLGTAVADSTGQSTLPVTIPSDPYGSTVTIAAVGSISKLVATSTITPYPGITLQPASGLAGSTVQVQGGDFASGETITVAFGTQTVATATAGADGTFSASFQVPVPYPPTSTYVTATGSQTGNTFGSAGASFISVPAIQATPTTGQPGTTITVTGQGYAANWQESIVWYDQSTNSSQTLATVTTDANGTFTQTVTIPSNAVSGHTYYINTYYDAAQSPVAISIP